MHPTVERPERYVLCLDDDRNFLKSLELLLPDRINSGGDANAMYHFVFADDPAQALKTLAELVAESSTVAMIITDQQMPSMKGTDFLLHARRITPNSIRILLTGHAGIEAAISAINDHLLERYLTKPIEDHHDFALNVRQLLQRFEMSRVIERQSATLQGLYEFANRINGMADMQAMRDYVVGFTRERLHCSVVHVDVPDARGTALPDASVGASKSVSSPARTNTALAGARALTTGWLADGDDFPADLGALVRRMDLTPETPAAYAPMRMGESCTGSILALRDAQECFTDLDLQTLGYIADTASTAIEKQRMWICLEDAYRLTKEQATHLEETLQGSIKALTDVLALTNPASFGKANRIKEIVHDLAERMGLRERWQVEVAVMLSQLGSIILPPETAERLNCGEALSDRERLMVERMPAVTEQLLCSIPRTEVVRAILAQQGKPFSRLAQSQGHTEEALIARGGQLLTLAADFDALESQGLTARQVIDTLRGRTDQYDPEILDALTVCRGSKGAQTEIREIPVDSLRAEMVLAEDMRLRNGVLIITRGFEVTASFIERLKNFGRGAVKEPVRVIVHVNRMPAPGAG